LILDKDIISQEEEDEPDDDEQGYDEDDLDDDKKKKMWFMISGDWLFQWKCFISNKISSSANVS